MLKVALSHLESVANAALKA